MGGSLCGLSRTDRDGTITQDKAGQVQSEVGLSRSLLLQLLNAFLEVIFYKIYFAETSNLLILAYYPCKYHS